jgi:hypothetical protein
MVIKTIMAKAQTQTIVTGMVRQSGVIVASRARFVLKG